MNEISRRLRAHLLYEQHDPPTIDDLRARIASRSRRRRVAILAGSSIVGILLGTVLLVTLLTPARRTHVQIMGSPSATPAAQSTKPASSTSAPAGAVTSNGASHALYLPAGPTDALWSIEAFDPSTNTHSVTIEAPAAASLQLWFTTPSGTRLNGGTTNTRGCATVSAIETCSFEFATVPEKGGIWTATLTKASQAPATVSVKVEFTRASP